MTCVEGGNRVIDMFQSTHLHEVWQVFLWDVKTRTMFQSTHLHEVWLRLYFLTLLAYSFNPHTYMRCDINFYILRAYFSSFNPHTYMRCDQYNEAHNLSIKVSIHTPTWGVTNRVYLLTLTIKFQSTHLHEVWRMSFFCDTPVFDRFNPHTYMRCDPQKRHQQDSC